MPLLQINLTEAQDAKLEHYKIIKKYDTKVEALADLIDNLNIEVKIKK